MHINLAELQTRLYGDDLRREQGTSTRKKMRKVTEGLVAAARETGVDAAVAAAVSSEQGGIFV